MGLHGQLTAFLLSCTNEMFESSCLSMPLGIRSLGIGLVLSHGVFE